MSVLPTAKDDRHLAPDETHSLKTRRRLLALGALTAAAAALVLLAIAPTPRLSLNQSFHLEHSATPGRCADAAPLAATAPHQNVWKNFDVQEATAIRQWLWAYRGLDGHGFNLTSGIAATEFDNCILLIENFTPSKAEVLEYLDQDGASPERFAKVFLSLGAVSPPSLEQYLLGPLPTPISSLSLSAASLQLQPLKHIFTNPDIPYTARLYPMNMTYVEDFVLDLIAPLHNATQDLLGGTVVGGRFPGPGNTEPETGVPDLVFGASTPFSYDGTFRRMWFQLKQNTPGSYLKALDMYFYIDFTAMDPKEWYLIRMVYNRQVFKNTDEFIEAYRNGTLKRSKAPDVPPTSETTWADRARRGAPRDLDDRAGPRQVSFNGPRYRVDKAEQWVSWMGWSFYLSFARDMGLSLWDVKFRGERILYEVAPQEALAVYSGSDPHQGSTVFLDGGFGMGSATRALIVGYDCPHEAQLLPSIVHTVSGTALQEGAICVFERDSGKPLSRHTGYLKNEMGAIKGYELIVRTISTVGNYDYLFDYTFQLDGTMEVRVSASGYLQGAWWDDAENDYGTKIRDTYMGSLHDHVINYKLDFDIAGTRNSLLAVTLENEVVNQPWFDGVEDDDWAEEVHQQKIVRTMVRNESDALLNYPPNLEGLYAIVNEEETNRWGYPRGYAIHPGVSPIHLTNLESKRTRNNVNFAKHHLAVSRRKDSEPKSSSMWNINLPGAPPVDFYKFFDGESLEQEDLTVWLNLGMHHIPRAEDSPMTLTNIATSSVFLTPFNFNDWDPAMESMNAVLVNVPEPGEEWSADENGVESEYCLPPRVGRFDYRPPTTFEEDGTPGSPLRVHEMRQQAESYHAIFAATEL
ncbi:amine oxidase catalytic domain-containing protein [Roridomyces roridus]|uniref:Amine oxidase n=1 Tax=Roridomyces roridus TaxID=1738132 RepID=A0AAD7CCC1_9AGAR|nr:amine oxidase catalytic domain-containing protein [Roridomyces roridus]